MLGVAAAGQDDDVITGSAQIDPSGSPVPCKRCEATSHESAISNQSADKPSASFMLQYGAARKQRATTMRTVGRCPDREEETLQTPDVLMTGIVFGEQPRWHDGRLWFSDWGTQEVIAVDPDGSAEVMYRGSSFPLCVDWLPDGRLLVVDTSTSRLLVREADGSLEMYADLRQGSDPPPGNELVV